MIEHLLHPGSDQHIDASQRTQPSLSESLIPLAAKTIDFCGNIHQYITYWIREYALFRNAPKP